MCKKTHITIVSVTLVVVVLAAVEVALCATKWSVGSGLWSDPANWSDGEPNSNTVTEIHAIEPGTGPIIDANTPEAYTSTLWGPALNPGDYSILTINGGALTTSGIWGPCQYGGTAEIYLNAGQVNAQGGIFLPNNSINGTALFQMEGGSVITPFLEIRQGGTLHINTGGSVDIGQGLDLEGGTLIMNMGSIATEELNIVSGDLNLYGGLLSVTSEQSLQVDPDQIEISSGGKLEVGGDQTNEAWLDNIIFSVDPGDSSGHKNVLYDLETNITTISSTSAPPPPDPNRRAVLNGFILTRINSSIDLGQKESTVDIDIGCVGQVVAEGFEQWSQSDSEGGCSGLSNGSTYTTLLDGSVTFQIRAFIPGDCAFRNRHAVGSVGGDLVHPENGWGLDDGKMLLTIRGLAADEYRLITYHNDPVTKMRRCNLNAIVTANNVLEWTNDMNVMQTASPDDGVGLANLGFSLVTFMATGLGDVDITFAPTGEGAYGPPELIFKVGINGFRLFKKGAMEEVLIEP